jgi:hypothetical protein
MMRSVATTKKEVNDDGQKLRRETHSKTSPKLFPQRKREPEEDRTLERA